jgi:predicted nucleotidyltransferase
MNHEVTQLAEDAGRAARAEQVWIFGSQARGDATAGSDLDLALILPDGVDGRAALRAALRATLDRKIPVDMVAVAHSNWATGGTALSRRIREEGVRVYAS